MRINQDFIPAGKSNRPGYPMTPEYITIHQTGNASAGANAEMHARYLKNPSTNVASWHYTVDDAEIYQHLPLTENGWHAADGTNGPGNRKSIGIEGCINRDGDLAKAEDNMAWLAAKLIKEVSSLKPFPECMKQHYDWNNTRNCPRQIRERRNGWEDFLAQVKEYLKPEDDFPPIQRTIGVKVEGIESAIPGYLMDNTTYTPALAVAREMGGDVTPHVDYINIIKPKGDPATIKELNKEIARLREKLEDKEMELAEARRDLEAIKNISIKY